MLNKPVSNFLGLPYVILMTFNESWLPESMIFYPVTAPVLPLKGEIYPHLSSLLRLLKLNITDLAMTKIISHISGGWISMIVAPTWLNEGPLPGS